MVVDWKKCYPILELSLSNISQNLIVFNGMVAPPGGRFCIYRRGFLPPSIPSARGKDSVSRRFGGGAPPSRSGTAVAYLRSGHSWQAVLSLLVGITLSVAVIIVVPAVYWMANGWGDVRGPLRAGSAVMGVMFLPALMGAIHHYVKSRQVVSP
jgi:hypothetical protein